MLVVVLCVMCCVLCVVCCVLCVVLCVVCCVVGLAGKRRTGTSAGGSKARLYDDMSMNSRKHMESFLP